MEAYGNPRARSYKSFWGRQIMGNCSDPTHNHLYSSINSLDFKQESPDLCNSWQDKNLALYLNWWSSSSNLYFLIHSWSHMVIFHISPTGRKCLWFPSYSFSLPFIFILLWLIIPFSATASDQLLFRFSLLDLLNCHLSAATKHASPHIPICFLKACYHKQGLLCSLLFTLQNPNQTRETTTLSKAERGV